MKFFVRQKGRKGDNERQSLSMYLIAEFIFLNEDKRTLLSEFEIEN